MIPPTEILQLHNALAYRNFPVKCININSVEFYVTFKPEDIPGELPELIKFLEPVIEVVGLDSKVYTGKSFLKDLPTPIFFTLFTEYFIFYQKTMESFTFSMEEYVKTPMSINLWTTLKSVGAKYVIGDSLNILQHSWLLHNANKDEEKKYKLISNVIDVLKPWLSPELYSKVQENEKATRENWQYDDPDIEERLRGQADTILKERNKQNQSIREEDLDIIEIGDEDA